MKLLASLAFGAATLVASSLGFAQPAMADDDVTLGVRLGPVCVGLCIGDDDDYGYGGSGDGECYDWDCDGTGFYAHRDYYHQRYDRRPEYERDDGYAGYRRHGRHHKRDHDRDDYGDDDGDD